MFVEVHIGDVVRLRKPHPCGGYEWRVVRLGADIGLSLTGVAGPSEQDGQPVGTLFLPGERLTSRKHWLAFTTRTHGALVIDEGAIKAVVKNGRSLLPAGIVGVKGEF
ncbi:MAG: DUF951 family protein, partial [Anaerolineae bacterium]|nr:DUF951 family protein [Anaerolineae bacterium]